MAETAQHNDQNPTDPTTLLALMFAIIWAAGHLTHDQTQALASAGGIAELAVLLLSFTRERR